jgi:flagellar hook-associated protein 2
MSTPITLSGFNNIDFNSIINALMQQASLPMTSLQTQQQTLTSQNSNYSALATKLGTLETAAGKLASASSLAGTKVTNTNQSAVSLTTSSATPQGTYSVVVNALAQAQVTASTSTYADSNSTIVASGGSITIGGATVTLAGDTTLQGLADAINTTDGAPVTAAVVQSSPGAYELVLTGKSTGTANAFTVTNNLTGGTGISFGANAQNAADASATVNGLAITSSTNTIESAIPGGTLTLAQADPGTTITLTVTQDTSNAKTLVQGFVDAYNDLQSFISSQQQAYQKGDTTSIANDGLLRNLSIGLRGLLGGSGGTDPTYTYLAQVGIGFEATGNLSFDSARFDDAATGSLLEDVQKLFSGSNGTNGVFSTVNDLLDGYVGSGGLVASQQHQITDQLQTIGRELTDMQNQLNIQRQSLVQQYAAADSTISSLNNQASSLSGLASQYSIF